MLDEILESPGFWILSALGVGAEILGYIMARNMELELMPLWQLIVMIIATLCAAAFFALKD